MQQTPLKIQNTEFKIRRAFTLTELLIVMTIIGILAGLGFSAFSGAITLSRQQRTGSIINKIDQLIGERYEGYRTRAVPVKIPSGTSSRVAAMIRLNALRDLMRMELPDRKFDVLDAPCDCDPRTAASPSVINVIQMTSPALRNSYIRRAMRATGTSTVTALSTAWTTSEQGAECLYLILSTMRDGDKSALDFFDTTEIGDTDGDGMLEILDGWGMPLAFIRWPAGYAEQLGPDGSWGVAGTDDDGNTVMDDIWEAGWPGSDDNLANSSTLIGSVPTMQTKNYFKAPDPFDPVKIHSGTAPSGFTSVYSLFPSYTPGYSLHPLIVSAGPNKLMDIVTDVTAANGGPLRYSPPTPSSPYPVDNYPNPYINISANLGSAQTSVTIPIGTPGDTDFDGLPGYIDNISNHSLRSQQ
jgi:prepilin-type N-terminal cleavage/methylation domain-containing protein